MRKIVVSEFMSLDGVMQAPGAPDEDREGGFEHGGWSAPHFDEGMGEVMSRWTDQADALLLGRKTYEISAAHWPNAPGEDPMAAKLNSVPKYVASRTLETADWENSTLLEGDVAGEVAELKERIDGEIQVAGSSDLIQTLIKNDLVDEYRLLIFPVVLGSGKRLFGDGTIPGGLRLVDAQTSTTGVAMHTYERAGKPEYGSFALEE